MNDYVGLIPRRASGVFGWCAQGGGGRAQSPPLPARQHERRYVATHYTHTAFNTAPKPPAASSRKQHACGVPSTKPTHGNGHRPGPQRPEDTQRNRDETSRKVVQPPTTHPDANHHAGRNNDRTGNPRTEPNDQKPETRSFPGSTTRKHTQEVGTASGTYFAVGVVLVSTKPDPPTRRAHPPRSTTSTATELHATWSTRRMGHRINRTRFAPTRCPTTPHQRRNPNHARTPATPSIFATQCSIRNRSASAAPNG